MAHQNPHSTRPAAAQQRFPVNVLTRIVGDCLLGPYLLPSRSNDNKHLTFLQTALPDLMNEIPDSIPRRMLFQLDRAPAHFANAAFTYLIRKFDGQCISRGGLISWSPLPHYLSPIDFSFARGAKKNMVYETPVDSAMNLVAAANI